MENDIQSPLPLFSANLTPSEHSLCRLELQLSSWNPSVVTQTRFGELQQRFAIPPSCTSCTSVPALRQLCCLNPLHVSSPLLGGLPQEMGQSSHGGKKKISLHSIRWLNCAEASAAYFLSQKVTKPLPDQQGSCRVFSCVPSSCRKAACTSSWLAKTLRTAACPALWKSEQHNQFKNLGKPL